MLLNKETIELVDFNTGNIIFEYYQIYLGGTFYKMDSIF